MCRVVLEWNNNQKRYLDMWIGVVDVCVYDRENSVRGKND